VIAANTVITGSTKIIDVTGSQAVEYRGYVPPRSVVIPGTYPRDYPSGRYNIPCALIIGERKESTDKKTSLNNALRENDVMV
jgi:2,3,4,5-tetrahydropyridine-2-carboxylate N-succinyltransferase